jgi:hypothetical protein
MCIQSKQFLKSLIDRNLNSKIGKLNSDDYSHLLANTIKADPIKSKQQSLATVSSTQTSLTHSSSETSKTNVIKLPYVDPESINGVVTKVNRVEDNSGIINFLSETQNLEHNSSHKKMNKIDFYLKLKGFLFFYTF